MLTPGTGDIFRRHHQARYLAALLLAAPVTPPASTATIHEFDLKLKTLEEDHGILISTPAFYQNGAEPITPAGRWVKSDRGLPR